MLPVKCEHLFIISTACSYHLCKFDTDVHGITESLSLRYPVQQGHPKIKPHNGGKFVSTTIPSALYTPITTSWSANSPADDHI